MKLFGNNFKLKSVYLSQCHKDLKQLPFPYMEDILIRKNQCVLGNLRVWQMCTNFHLGTKMKTENFLILAKIYFSARTTNKIRLNL